MDRQPCVCPCIVRGEVQDTGYRTLNYIISISLETVGKQLQYNNPFIYSASHPSWLSSYPSMEKVSQHPLRPCPQVFRN